MKKITTILTILGVVLIFAAGCGGRKTAKSEKITFETKDGLKVTADLYIANSMTAPFILLCHQSSSSRGEYLEIAPRLNKLGFNCMAIDQRSGKNYGGVKNETTEEAKNLKLPIGYTDAITDMEAALDYIKNELKVEKAIVWGSSYSSSLAFVIADKNPDFVSGVLAFSPGEYFMFEGEKIEDYASRVKMPVFITCKTVEKPDSEPIYNKTSSDKKVFFLPTKGTGVHGSQTLTSKNEHQEEYWEAVEKFLGEFKKK